jgi:hypothetical protein
MEIIKKTFKTKAGSSHSFIILLTSTVKDMGFFDTVLLNYSYGYFLDDSYDGIGLGNLE